MQSMRRKRAHRKITVFFNRVPLRKSTPSKTCQLSRYHRETHGFDCFLPVSTSPTLQVVVHFLPADLCKIKSDFSDFSLKFSGLHSTLCTCERPVK